VAVVRKPTIPTERPPLVDEICANPLRIESVAWSAQRIPKAVNIGFYRPAIDRKRLGKQASATIKAVFSLRSVRSLYKISL
jgi:hypothetical protein